MVTRDSRPVSASNCCASFRALPTWGSSGSALSVASQVFFDNSVRPLLFGRRPDDFAVRQALVQLDDYRFVQKWGRAVREAKSALKVMVVEQTWTAPGMGGGSLFSDIGFLNGDIVQAINGERIDSPNKALALYEALKNKARVTVLIERDGQPKTIRYTIR